MFGSKPDLAVHKKVDLLSQRVLSLENQVGELRKHLNEIASQKEKELWFWSYPIQLHNPTKVPVSAALYALVEHLKLKFVERPAGFELVKAAKK